MGSMSFRENFRHCSQEPARSPTKQDTPHLSRQQVSQVSAQELTEHILILTYQGGSRFEFQLCCLRIPFVSQGVVCFHSVSLQVSWTFTMIVFKEIPLCAFMEEVSASFNTQAKVPDHQWAPCIFVEKPRHGSPVPPRSPTNHDIPTISLQLDSPDCAQELFKRILCTGAL